MAHTPGPIDKPIEQTFADMRLCAAAPDLLIACRVALNDRMYKDWPKIADILMNAIIKAGGEI